MMYFSRFKTTLIVLACIVGTLLCVPNLMPQPAAWLPWHTVRLGLDLQGGSYLLLEVDMKSVIKERLESLTDAVRQALRPGDIFYAQLQPQPEQNRVLLKLRDPARLDAALAAVQPLVRPDPGSAPDLTIDSQPDGTITLTLSQPALVLRAQQAVTQSIEIIRRRIDETGVLDPQITRQGEDRIAVQLPGIQDPNRIKELLGKTAHMTFQLVDETASPAQPPPPGDEVLPMQDQPGVKIVVRKRIDVDGADLTDARAASNPQTGQWVVAFGFNSVGARRFADVTREHTGHRFAIVLDNQVISAPVIREPILGGRGEISGNFTASSATDLAVLLRAGALPAPLTVVEERSVGPELGADSIRAGALSLAVGFVLVIVYMGVFYGLFGWFANLALVVNLFLMLAILSFLQATLTLPGMAGILLTLGMAVDANILINERIREESRAGRPPLAALENGFKRAYATIFDTNTTAFLAHVMLFTIGSGPVRGFAVTIMVGIATTMFTAWMLTRLLVSKWYVAKRPKVLPLPRLRLAPDDTSVKFMRGRIIGLATSAVLSTASVALFVYPGLNLGIDFSGGVIMEVRTQGPADFGAIRGALSGVGEQGVQQFGAPDHVLIRLPAQPSKAATEQQVGAVQAALAKAAPGSTVLRTDAVGSSVSSELFDKGLIALGVSLLMILAYIWFRFEWQFAVGAVATLILDVTKAIGFLALTRLDFDLVMVASILTVVGYSTNDKVVVYDRVRENLRKYRTMPLRELIDLSINETLNRTLGTSMTVFLAAVPLALFGGPSISGFAILMLFGIVVGTSSSIFIAAPILLFLGEHRLRRDTAAPKAPAQKAPVR
ncbi:MAG TPA: protein translocase subunit SecD [Acidisphaera sp.]|nr:protein translocase subunit SecD [Acidisphaera sp.]